MLMQVHARTVQTPQVEAVTSTHMDDILKGLDGIDMGLLKKLNDATKAASRRGAARSSKEPIRDQVTARLGPADMGTVMQAMGRALTGAPMASAPLVTPPITTGLTVTMKKIHEVIMKHQFPSRSERQITSPSLRLWKMTIQLAP